MKMRVQDDISLQLLMPSNETTVTLGDKISVTDNMNLFFGAPAQVKDRFPLQLSAKSLFIVLTNFFVDKIKFLRYNLLINIRRSRRCSKK